MKIIILSANFKNFDKETEWEAQGENVIGYKISEETFPLRVNALTPRMQAKIVKCFGWQLFPGYDVYVWVDASFKMFSGATEWLLRALADKDAAFFRHPSRKTIAEEYEFMKKNANKRYIRYRYTYELLEEQYNIIAEDRTYEDTLLLCGGIFIYRNNEVMRNALKEWWYHITRYHLNDQLSLPYVLLKSGCKFNIIEDDIYKLALIPFMRNG